ncbi:hypothetical protein SLE2022_134050 [Rubroshorea leprosula]
MPTFLPELVTDILLLLPVKSLLRFRCLSTSHCSEIDSADFVKNHLNISIQKKIRQKLLFCDSESITNGFAFDFYCADFDDDLKAAFLLKNPLKSPHRCTMVCASYNGLILLGFRSNNLALWNPFARRYRRLPLCPVKTLSGFQNFVNFGLGYDSALDDYKVVTISEFHDSNHVVFQAWVFSLKSNSWKRSQDVENKFTALVGCFANGALYWECDNKFVGFDLTNEVFFDLPLFPGWDPKSIYHHDYDILVVFGGNLYASIIRDEHKSVEFYLFVSDKSGEVAGGSWRKEFTLEEGDLSPLAYSKEGDKILFRKGNEIFWYNLEEKTRQRVVVASPVMTDFLWITDIFGRPEVPVYNYHVCCESLVSLGNDAAFDGASY